MLLFGVPPIEFEGNEDDFSLTSLRVIENTFGKSISAYPNPTKSVVNLDLGEIYKTIEIKIFDNLGKLIQQYSYKNEVQ